MPKPLYASVIGDPIAHSRSPLIHGAWLKHYHIDGTYDKIHVKADDLRAFTQTIRDGKRAGANVTLPHKIAVTQFCDQLTPAAKAIGAVNTLFMENGQLIGDNTDAYGFAANLDDQLPTWKNAQTALVVGAGGAARAVLYALQEAGIVQITFLNRTLATADALAQQFKSITNTGSIDAFSALIPEADLIINTTSMGIADKASEQTPQQFNPWDFEGVKPNAMAADIVYVPLMTPFLSAAQSHGLALSDGLGMLLHQAVPGFERWFGVRPNVTLALRQTILDDL